ncbi:peptidylprolyl isomerase [Flavihumibacter stibioxidans]|uniref:PpiC domain-containing protein n=1 Tax=Flavihumibacter stibioxidans TaxID=1834163 RepID=A0ABR7M9X6_9BACT|nr:peptidylprolyl isomerase [Flavihumibacter stibioxidans]MBC6491853.1 hypothetical protein [Flavihumibacter stibioxidans]
MKNQLLCLLISAIVSVTTVQAQTLFTYGKHVVEKDEFLKAFKKNNNGQKADQAAYRNYLDLYIRYKLKVQAAYDLRIDTLPSQRSELESFRNQVSGNYMYDEATLHMLVKEAEANSSKDIRLSHIYIPYTGNDTAEAFRLVTMAASQLKNGRSFEAVATELSRDPSVKVNKGDIGWISSFTLPYALEKIAYGTPLNQNSPVFRGRGAYHIFRPTAERPAAGTVQVAQILLEIPADADRKQTDSVSRFADSLYRELLNGADFGKLAYRHSADNSSYQNNGILPAFRPGTYAPEFEDQAFVLKQEDAISKPFQTSQGFHIIRRLKAAEMVAGSGQEISLPGILEKVKEDERGQLAHEAVIEKVKKLTGFRVLAFDPKAIEANTKLAMINGEPVMGMEYLQYKTGTGEGTEQFFKMKLLEEYRNRLEKYEPEFADQLKEFRDGNMLFEVMQRNVWEKASADEEGLKKFYAQHAGRYRWKENVKTVIFTGTDSATTYRFHQLITKDPAAWRSLTESMNGAIQADSGRFETDQLPVTYHQKPEKGMVTEPVRVANDLGFVFMYIIETLPGKDIRSFEEARGFVLNDYQEKLEEEWVGALRKQYPVTVNQSVLKSLNR